MSVQEKDETRLKNSVHNAMKQGDGLVMILDKDTETAKYYSRRLMCPTTGISYSDPAPNIFHLIRQKVLVLDAKDWASLMR